jgi:hypothetical protein
MPHFKLAHVREQRQDMLIFPLDHSFGNKTADDQREALAELQMRAHGTGLAGKAVAVWDAGGGRMAFLGPTNWQAFLRSINLRFVLANVNREISW